MKKSSKPNKTTRRRRERQNDAEADWGTADSGLLASVIEAVTNSGGAIRFGYSGDGGAYAIGIYGDGDAFTEYLGATEEVDHWLEGFREDYS